MAELSLVTFIAGAAAGTALIASLALTLAVPALRIWPTPGNKTWQSYLFWPLFRSLNLLCFAAAALDRTPYAGLPASVRSLGLLALAGSLATFLYSFRVLGRDKSYCAADGLVTHGIYQWSRNPQNAMLVVVYASLAIVADSLSAYILCTMMMAVYVLMVLCEEPWLSGIYGEPYREYCRSVPRFFNWRRLLSAGAGRSRS